MMKEYWLLLEAYVFLWYDSKEILIYNSLSGKGFLFENKEKLEPIVEQLADKSNLYVISIGETVKNEPDVADFISSLKEEFCGDLIHKSICPQKPVVIIPELTVNEESFKGELIVDRDFISGAHANKNLLSLTLHLNGQCEINCPDCQHVFKQTTWCTKSDNTITKVQAFGLLNQLKGTSVNKIEIIGGDVLSLNYWNELIAELSNYSIKKNVYLYWKLITDHIDCFNVFERDDFDLWILIDNPDKDQILKLIGELRGIKCNYVFNITEIEEYEIADEIIQAYNLNARIIPYYNNDNLSFFEENIFQNIEDILNTKWSKNQIFAHTVLNSNDFGQLEVMSNGDVYSNINSHPIGNIASEDVKDIVNKEIKTGRSWCKTRNDIEPCSSCLCKYVCPSLSNYEITIGKNNLCNK